MDATGTRQIVMVEAIWLKPGVGREVALILGGSFLIALSAQVQFVLPFSPVPITQSCFWLPSTGVSEGWRLS